MDRLIIITSCFFIISPALALPANPPSEPPSPELSPAKGPKILADRDRDGLSDDLQAKLAEAGPNDPFPVIVTFKGPGNATSARQAVGDFDLHREFRIIRGFSGTMTAAQIRALARQPGVFRVEENITLSVNLDVSQSVVCRVRS